MKRKTISFALTLCIIITTCSLVFSVVHLYFEMPMSVTIKEKPSILIYVDDQPWNNGTTIAWGQLDPGTIHNKTLDIKNTGNINLQISLATSGLPSGWDLAYTKNGTLVQPNKWLNGTLTLTVPATALNGTYAWNTYIYAS